MAKELTPKEKAEKRLKNYDPVMAARQALRRAFSRSPVVVSMMMENRRKAPRFTKNGARHKVDAVEHLCNVCHKWKRSSKGLKVVIDHIEPVVDPDTGFVDFNTYFKRMWCDRSNLQKICGECHREKTNAEWFRRRFKTEQDILNSLEGCHDKDIIRKSLKRFTNKKLANLPYPKEFIQQLEKVRNRLK